MFMCNLLGNCQDASVPTMGIVELATGCSPSGRCACGYRRDLGNCRIDGVAKPAHDLIDIVRRDDVRRCQQHVIALRAVDRSAARISHEPARHALRLDSRVEAQRRIERRLGDAIGNQLECAKKTAAANVTDMRMIGEACDQCLRKIFTAGTHVGEQAFVAEWCPVRLVPLRSKRVTDVGMPVLEGAGTAGDRLE
jgi:hypothetical protein